MSDNAQASQLIQEGVEAGRAGDTATARQKLADALRLDNRQAEGWYWMAYFLDDRERRIACLHRALVLDPSHEPARELLRELTRPVPAEEDEWPEDFVPQKPERKQSDKMQQAVSQAGEAAGAAARVIGQTVRGEFSGEKGQNLLRAWLAVLRFDAANSYEVYRDKPNPLFTAILTVVVFALIPVVMLVFSLLSGGAGDFFGALLRTFGASLFFSAQVVLSLYVASYVSAYIGRTQFKSEVSAAQHFGMSGLYFIPTSLLIAAVLIVLNNLVAPILARILTFQGVVLLGTALSYTAFVLAIFGLVQFCYSNAAIHRVKAWQALLISAVSFLAAMLVFVWLVPFTLPLLPL